MFPAPDASYLGTWPSDLGGTILSREIMEANAITALLR
jgi:hypothetical protein